MMSRALVTVTGKLKQLPGGPYLYMGVTELANTGFAVVEIVLPHGTNDFPQVPYMVTVDCESTMAEFRKGKCPLLTVTDWQPMTHYYM